MFEFYEIQHFSGSDGGWLQSLLGGLIGALISAGIAWYISRKNLDDQRQLELESRNNEAEAKGLNRNQFLSDQLSHFIELLESVIEDKIDTYKKNQIYIEQYKKQPLGYHTFKIEVNGDIPRLHEFDTLELKMAIQLQFDQLDDKKVYRALINAIDYYKIHTKRLFEFRNDTLGEWTEIGLLIQKSLNKIRADLADLLYKMKNNSELNADEKCFYSSLSQLLSNYLVGLNENNKTDLEYHKTEFIDKGNALTIQQEDIYGFCPEIFREVKDTQLLFSNLSGKGNEIASVIERLDSHLKKQNDSITATIQTHFNPDFLKPSKEQSK